MIKASRGSWSPPTPQPLVLVVGPFPPPVHGLAVVTARVADGLTGRAVVRRFDVTGRAGVAATGPRLVTLLRRALSLGGILVRVTACLLCSRPAALVIGGSAGGAMCFDAVVSLLATAVGVPVFVHHHSFAHLMPDSRRGYHSVAQRLMRRHCHIVLCDHMGRLLARQHQVASARIITLSNAAFVPSVSDTSHVPQVAERSLGFLSNISESKGILDFFSLAERLRIQGHRISLLIAGPVDGDVLRQFEQRIARFGDAVYLGAVEDTQKAAFFSRIDLLVLPSRHVHEAEPLVMIEALAHGVPVLSTRRGCMPSVWEDALAMHTLDETDFVEQACTTLAPWIASAGVRAEWAAGARGIHARLHVQALQDWQALCQRICTPRN